MRVYVCVRVLAVRRDQAMQDGLKKAVGVPMSLAERVTVLWPNLKELVMYGNLACKSDIQVRAGERRERKRERKEKE